MAPRSGPYRSHQVSLSMCAKLYKPNSSKQTHSPCPAEDEDEVEEQLALTGTEPLVQSHGCVKKPPILYYQIRRQKLNLLKEKTKESVFLAQSEIHSH